MRHVLSCCLPFGSLKNRYNNELKVKVKLVGIFADVEKGIEEREESLAFVLAPSLARKHRYLWAQIEVYVRKSKKKKGNT